MNGVDLLQVLMVMLNGDSAIRYGVQETRLENIVEGVKTLEGEWPWLVSIQVKNTEDRWKHTCGGTLIKSNWVLTAAHCMTIKDVKHYRVILGEYDQSQHSGNEKAVPVSLVVIHKDFRRFSPGIPNDLALVKLKFHIKPSLYIRPVNLGNIGESFLGNSDCKIIGWGKTNATGRHSKVLRAAHTSVLVNRECASWWSTVYAAKIRSSHICVFDAGEGACVGDSGGPLVCNTNRGWVLSAVASWGVTGCIGYPSVYSSVPAYIKWIEKATAAFENMNTP